ncbi:hypothetical protein, partial [Klebsiella variicola]
AASTSGNPSFSVLRQLQYLCELTHTLPVGDIGSPLPPSLMLSACSGLFSSLIKLIRKRTQHQRAQ